jgi:hypothetical protein
MFDMNIEYFRTCAANVRWTKSVTGSKGDIYEVHYGETPHGPYAYGWTCTCYAGQHGKECKHVKACKAEKCEWNWEAFMGSSAKCNPDNTCPKCGGPTEVIKVAV